jgi:hypothetical protein
MFLGEVEAADAALVIHFQGTASELVPKLRLGTQVRETPFRGARPY